jgi:hypothetical protein
LLKEPVPCGNPKIIETMNASQRSISKDWLKAIKRDDKLFCAWCNKNELPATRKKYCSEDCVTTSTAYCTPSTTLFTFYYLMTRQNNCCANCNFSYEPTFQASRKEQLKWERQSIGYTIDSIRRAKESAIKIHKELKCEFLEIPAYLTYRATGGVSVHYAWTRKEAEKTLQGHKDWYKQQRNKLREQLADYFESKKKDFEWRWNTPDYVRAYHRKLKDGKEPEIDHIIPVALDGMAIGFDNVQILCYSCHKKKTFFDMKEIRAKRQKERQEMFFKD